MAQITITISPEVKAALQQEAAERGQGIQDLVEQIVSQQVLRPHKTNEERREAVRRMQEFAEKNRTSLEGISIKELIHEGHRV